MSIIEAIVLGTVQGLTEFIPVSSSGHLVLLENMMRGASDHMFLEFINIGTVGALLFYFRLKIVSMIKEMIVNKNIVLFRNILITSIPAGLVGYIFADFIASTPFFGSVVTVMIALLLVGIVMITLDRLPHMSAVNRFDDLSAARAFIIGLVQMCALVPGVSRSGSTIIAGRLLGLSSRDAAEYSFLASIPIMLAVTAKIFVKEGDRAYFIANMPTLIIANIIAFITGLIAIGFLLKYLSNNGLTVFGWYRIALAGVVAMAILIQLT